MRWPAPAKINLFLHIVGRRPDGYHLLQTWFQFIDWCDWLEFEVIGSGDIERINEIEDVPEADDLVIRAARLLQEATNALAGARIRVEKNIPMGGGLGGGSSDAATTLVALNQLWGTGMAVEALAALGLSLGADVPVFVRGAAAWAEGVGEQITPLEAPMGYVLVIFPRCHVNTARIFQHPELTRDTPTIKIHHLSQEMGAEKTRNDCEIVTCLLYPEVDAALRWLRGHAVAHMSGTGACVFAYFDSEAQAQAVANQVPDKWQKRVSKRLNRSPLLDCIDESVV